MYLEVGQVYNTRNGKLVKIISMETEGSIWNHLGEFILEPQLKTRWWQEDGTHTDQWSESDHDLISKYAPPIVAPPLPPPPKDTRWDDLMKHEAQITALVKQTRLARQDHRYKNYIVSQKSMRRYNPDFRPVWMVVQATSKEKAIALATELAPEIFKPYSKEYDTMKPSVALFYPNQTYRTAQQGVNYDN